MNLQSSPIGPSLHNRSEGLAGNRDTLRIKVVVMADGAKLADILARKKAARAAQANQLVAPAALPQPGGRVRGSTSRGSGNLNPACSGHVSRMF